MSTEESKYDSYLLFVLTMSGTKRWGTKRQEQDKRIYGVKPGDWKDIYKAMSQNLNNYDEDEEFFDNELNVEEEIEILDSAYRNAYRVATGKISVADLLSESDDLIFLPFDPTAPETFGSIIDDVIDYFEDSEEYEKCAELVSIKNKIDNDDS